MVGASGGHYDHSILAVPAITISTMHMDLNYNTQPMSVDESFGSDINENIMMKSVDTSSSSIDSRYVAILMHIVGFSFVLLRDD